MFSLRMIPSITKSVNKTIILDYSEREYSVIFCVSVPKWIVCGCDISIASFIIIAGNELYTQISFGMVRHWNWNATKFKWYKLYQIKKFKCLW